MAPAEGLYKTRGRGLMKNASRLAATIVTSLAIVSVAAAPATARSTSKMTRTDQRPNILVVMTDDQALSDLQAMPNLASMVGDQGATFSNAVDSFPLCCPSRATFITGQYAHNHGVGGNFWPYGWYGMAGRDNTLPVWIHNSGYYTALVGKWLNGYGSGKAGDVDAQGNPIKPGGEVPAGFDNWNGGLDVSFYDYYNFKINHNGTIKSWGDSKYAQALVDFAEIQIIPPASKPGERIKEVLEFANKFFKSPTDPSTYGTKVAANYEPDVTAGLTKTIISGQKNSSKPFFVWWAPVAPHREDVNGGIRNGFRNNEHYAAKGTSSTLKHQEDTTKLIPDPRPAPRYESTVWDWSKISSKPNFDAAPTGKPLKQQLILASPMTDARKHQLEVDYAGRLGAVKAVDDGIKKLIDTLSSTNQLNNTVILFTSDNGWLQGEHRVPGDKYLPYEEAIRVPLVMRGPGIPSGRKVDTLVSNIDFASTLLDAAKVTNPGRVQDGISLLGAAKGTASLPSRAIGLEATAPLFADASMPQQWDQSYKGVRTDRWKYIVWDSGEKELYDLQNDPYELTNLADNPGYAATQSSLAAKMTQLSTCVGSDCRVAQ
jgi:arylsulfatase A-like enzyme